MSEPSLPELHGTDRGNAVTATAAATSMASATVNPVRDE